MLQMLPDMPMAAKFFVAFIIVLALIGLTAWLVRRFGANRLSGSARGRQPRLAVIDAASVDSRRRLVLIRRDNVEHLMMIGGPNDLVIEPNIVRAAAARDAGRETLREPSRPPSPEPRALPLGDNGNWPLQPMAEPPVQPPAPRAYRAPVTDEPWVAAEPPPREPPLRARSADSLTGMAAEFSARLNPDFDAPPPPPPRPAPAREPVVTAPPPAPAPSTAPPQTDHNLAEMAQRLEAALRRPNTTDMHAPVTDPLAASVQPPKPPEPRPPMRDSKPEPRADVKPEPKFEPKFDAKPAQAKNPFDSLEEEMASLLGRQSGKT